MYIINNEFLSREGEIGIKLIHLRALQGVKDQFTGAPKVFVFVHT